MGGGGGRGRPERNCGHGDPAPGRAEPGDLLDSAWAEKEARPVGLLARHLDFFDLTLRTPDDVPRSSRPAAKTAPARRPSASAWPCGGSDPPRCSSFPSRLEVKPEKSAVTRAASRGSYAPPTRPEPRPSRGWSGRRRALHLRERRLPRPLPPRRSRSEKRPQRWWVLRPCRFSRRDWTEWHKVSCLGIRGLD